MKIKISVYQLFSLMVMLPYATASLYFLTPELKQNVWIGILVYILPSIALQCIYLYLFKKYPKDTIVSYMPKILGKFIGTILSVVYILYFAYIAARDLRDFVELLLTDVIAYMPPYVIYICIMSIVTYGIYKGFENVARMAGVIIIVFALSLVIESTFLMITPHAIDFKNLLPIAEDGLIDIIKKGWPLITFPYGETITFTMLYPYVNQPEKVKSAAYLSIIVEGIILSLVNVMFIVSLGAQYAALSIFPHIVAMRLIRFGGFINRFDILLVILMIYAAFFKISVLTYVSVLGTAQIFKLKDTKTLVVPFCVVIGIASALIARNYPEHIKLGLDFTVKYIHIPVQIVIPLVVLLVYNIKVLFQKKLGNYN
ncbi:GerAB/ArcD/ProY family transporter [Clostridium omnivorum]|uniref:Germination protein GerKB n=1 Tax=Clostridium omnivorum TaxID=1604902 RepID=A0ABQ5N888_9CLOT|nr:spore germination protein [Clostridium sp. E14]GLC31414.1 germination protein GerKB [Clostridium sp. E14]